MREGLRMYDIVSPSYVFEDYMTIDGRYLILNDELFDLKEQRELGNIFSIENLKTLFENLDVPNSPLLEKIREILNNGKVSINEVKSRIIYNQKLLLEQEDLAAEPSVTSSEPQHSAIAKGVLWFARKLKKLLWSIGGMAVDAFLVASGIGKAVQWIPWAIVLILDVYQLSSGDYGTDTEFKEASPVWKALTIGFEVMGLMTTGVIAKGAMRALRPLKAAKSEAEMAKVVAANPRMKNILTKIANSLNGVSGKLKAAEQQVSKMPKLKRWIGKAVLFIPKTLGWLGKMIGRVLGTPGKLAQKAGEALQGSKALQSTNYFTQADLAAKRMSRDIGKGLKSGANTGMAVAGINTGINKISQLRSGLSSAEFSSLQNLENVINKRYGGRDPFSF